MIGGFMRKLSLLTSCLVLASAPLLLGAAPPSGPVDPQISYTRTSPKGYQLVAAKEDGTGAVVLTSSSRQLKGELGRDGRIYFWNGGSFNRMPATGGAVEPLFDSGGTVVRHSDISPNGQSVAWFSSTTGQLFRYDIAGGQQSLLASVPMLLDVSFDHTGNTIFFTQEVGAADYELMAIPAGGGSAGSTGLFGRISAIESARGDSTLAVTFNPAGASPYIAAWKQGFAPVKIVDGYNATYRCDDSAILFTKMTSPGPVIYRRETSGGITVAAKASAIWPSYRPVC